MNSSRCCKQIAPVAAVPSFCPLLLSTSSYLNHPSFYPSIRFFASLPFFFNFFFSFNLSRSVFSTPLFFSLSCSLFISSSPWGKEGGKCPRGDAFLWLVGVGGRDSHRIGGGREGGRGCYVVKGWRGGWVKCDCIQRLWQLKLSCERRGEWKCERNAPEPPPFLFTFLNSWCEAAGAHVKLKVCLFLLCKEVTGLSFRWSFWTQNGRFVSASIGQQGVWGDHGDPDPDSESAPNHRGPFCRHTQVHLSILLFIFSSLIFILLIHHPINPITL